MKSNKRVFDKFDGNLFTNLSDSVRLVLRLMADPRVPILLKVLPIGAAVYLFSPIDLLSFFPLDDAVIVGMGSYIFIEMCPQEVVSEHRMAIRNERTETPEEYIDVEFSE